MTQSHLIVKEEGICIYRVPDGSNFAENFQDGSGTGRYDEQGYQEAVKQAQSSAILCEDQERAIQIVRSQSTQPNFSLEIGSIYPVPGIEFEKLQGCGLCQLLDGRLFVCMTCEDKFVARLIEHTAMTPFKKLTAYDENTRSVATDHTEPIESPERDKEEESQEVSYGDYLDAVGANDNNTYARKIYERLQHNGIVLTRKP